MVNNFESKPYLIRILLVRPRLFLSIFIGILTFFFLPNFIAIQSVTRGIIAWNTGAIIYLGLAARMMFWSTHDKMKIRAEEDEGEFLILALAIVAVFFALASITCELSTVKEMHGKFRFEHIALVVLTILTSWSFTHTMFALHYAHNYYDNSELGLKKGLIFPDTELPDYGDFIYFAFIIGTSAQTADVSFSSKSMRRIGLVHCILSFFFNTTLLALTINIASGLF